MSYHWIVPLVAAILNAIVGLIVLRHDRQPSLNRCFGLLSVGIVFWNLNIFVLYSFQDANAALYWSGVFRVGTLMSAAFASHLMVLQSGSSSRIVWGLLGVSYAGAILLVCANATGYLVQGLQTYSWGFYPVGTRLYEVFPVLLLYNFLFAGVMLVHTARSSESPRERQQARLWIVGMLIAMPLGMTNMLATFGVSFYPLGNLASVVYASFMAYSIVRYRLMDIDIVLTKGGAYSLVSLLVIAPACGMVVWLESRSFGRIDIDFSVALFALFVIVAVVFPRLRISTERGLERSLFPKKHEYRTELASFTRSIVRILDRDELVRKLAETLGATLEVDRLAVALLDEPARTLVVRHAVGVAPVIGEFPLGHALVEAFSRRRDAVLFDEIQASHDPQESLSVADVFRANGWELCLPLMGGRRLLGFIALGRKRNLSTFFAEDLELLETLAAETAVALENASLHEELTRSQEIIRRADRLSALGTLAAGIAHEIRNPLVSIQTFFQLAPHRLNDQEFLTEFLRLTSSEVKRITDLISDLLSFARSPTPSRTEVDLNAVVEGVLRLLEPQLKTRQIAVRKFLAQDLTPTMADADQLKQVLFNILLNATQAIEGSGEIHIASREVVHKGQPYCQIEIADTGRGIPREMLDDIFNPFFTTKDKGTGLGLSITNQVISEHDGFITVESEVGQGTAFRIHLHPARTAGEGATAESRRAVGTHPRYW